MEPFEPPGSAFDKHCIFGAYKLLMLYSHYLKMQNGANSVSYGTFA